MKSLISTVCLLVGCYFMAYTGRLFVLRNAGYTPIFKLLDAVTGYLPYMSIAILLIVAFFSIMKNGVEMPKSLVIQFLSICIVPVIPVTIHIAMYSLTYSVELPSQRTLWKLLSVFEWVVFGVGILLNALGIFMVVRSRNN